MPRLRGTSHAIAFVFALAAAFVMIVHAATGHAALAATVYRTGPAALFGVSALYHRWPGAARFKPMLQRLDHSTIFVFIAASYTPLSLLVLPGALALVILGLAWVGAGGGVALSLGWIDASRRRTAGSYLTLGWLAAIATPQLVTELPLTALLLITGGGQLYSSGALVYALQRPSPCRERSASTRSSTRWSSSRPPSITLPCSAGCFRSMANARRLTRRRWEATGVSHDRVLLLEAAHQRGRLRVMVAY